MHEHGGASSMVVQVESVCKAAWVGVWIWHFFVWGREKGANSIMCSSLVKTKDARFRHDEALEVR